MNPLSVLRRVPRRWSVPLVLCVAAGVSPAQTVTPPYGIGDALKAVQPERAPVPAPPPAPVIQTREEAPLSLPDGATLTVKAFRFEGAELIAEDELQAELVSFLNRPLRMADIEAAASRITALYRQRGYLVARAYVPRQDARSGTLVLHILVGHFGQFSLKNTSRVADDLLRPVFQSLQGQGVVSRDGLERAMLLVGDMPGASLPRLTVGPGQAPGSSDFEVEVPEGPLVTGSLLGDNQGSRYTGRNRVSLGLDVNSPLGGADRLSLNAMNAEGGGLASGRLAYSVPLGSDGLRAELAGSKTTYELGSVYQDLGASGTAYSAEATLSYPALRSRSQNLVLSLNLAARHLRDDIDADRSSNPKDATVATLGLQHEAWGNLFNAPSYSQLNLGLTVGELDFTDASQRALNEAGAHTGGGFAHLNLGLQLRLNLNPAWTASAMLTAQKALHNKNLDSSEQMNLAGPGGVRAYRESVSGDNGALVSAELRYALPVLAGFSQSLGVFGDAGRVALQDGSYTTVRAHHLADLGLGWAGRWGDWVGKLQVARAVGAAPEDGSGKTRVLAQAGLAF
ncbi:ShlB/FhaC/HecB family hemolysin secretion/activation protein [Ideonella oryzae]|uniref:ShlB/FhaC/HecB family hemolysin secretion/activation protein n=1 Tax=Ideonella oryzae TaxID=2937441 RepID=A0ABT1BND0_9BURK|nr:ShlB/FhaC/HecB family hemolysin secretion/activation protein [Ideonella oryzae]MCO5977733.1 hypothetical protein [Ideonella oryzae]